MESLFEPLIAEGLTSLYVRHDWRAETTFALAASQWEQELEFCHYRQRFDHETELTTHPRWLDHEATLKLYERAGASAALKQLFELVAAGRHQGVDIWCHHEQNIRFISNMHSNVLALDNRRHALRAGGIRRHDPAEPEKEVLIDGLNLSRAMTFKNAAAQIPYGGSKICVIAEPIDLHNLEAIGFIAWCIDRSRSFTGPDMGLVPEHADVLRQRFTRNIVGGCEGALGPTGAPTARGLLVALREAVRHQLDRDELTGLSIAVQGLGAVGGPLAESLLAAGVSRLVVAEPDSQRLAAFLDSVDSELRQRIEVIEADRVLFAEVDVLSPNAVGGVLGAEQIEKLRCRIVMGAANNQLRAVSQEQEIELAAALEAKGILYQVDWMHNGAGVIAGYEEWEHQERASMDRVVEHLERICRDGVWNNLRQARERSLTPTAMAYRAIEARIYP